MIIDENYTGRRVRIIGKPGDEFPFQIQVLDADTNEIIDHVYRAEIILDIEETNAARLSYYEADQTGRLKDGPVEKKIVVSVAEIDVTALEVGDGD